MHKPFVISEDLEQVLRPWARARGFRLPNSAFFAGLLDQMVGMLKTVFGDVVVAEEAWIMDQLPFWAGESSLTCVSMDQVYFNSPWAIQVSRAVDENGHDIGLVPLEDAPSIQDQVDWIRRTCSREVVLVDDVVYSGQLIRRIIGELNQAGIQVVSVFAAVSVGQGEQVLREMRMPLRSVYRFDEVIDEVCQRDFFPGVPRCGRYLAGGDNVGLPYLLPFGKPGDWASIPVAHQLRFSQFCLEQTIWLFEAIEQASARQVDCSDLARRPIGVSATGRYVEILKQILKSSNP